VQRPVARPNSLIFTLYGDLVHRTDKAEERDGSLWIGTLIALMGTLGVSAAAVRQAVSRLSRQGWLSARRVGNRAYYSVTERGQQRIEDLSPRIYGPVIEWDGRWRVLHFAGGEPGRQPRDRLRKELRVLGWAPLTAATWISPVDALEPARKASGACGVEDDVHFFEGRYCGPLTDRQLVERCWDLQAIAGAYNAFIARYRVRLAEERKHGRLHNDQAFADRLWLVHDYRKFAYLDPGLPSELVPAHWPGTVAAALFREYYAALEHKSQRYFQQQR
ncbi:MAG: phenylacetic acid degradation operon negative regulatory protein PaaX, partial [Candidatus Eremiobacteraeota bacterium]|nr:phenylacetic acid degradation operon negative regulatory protein PaaX [Candidatus Eremiobacteraeota bacterium]